MRVALIKLTVFDLNSTDLNKAKIVGRQINKLRIAKDIALKTEKSSLKITKKSRAGECQGRSRDPKEFQTRSKDDSNIKGEESYMLIICGEV